MQIEDLSQQAQVAAAEKFKAPEISPAADVGAGTTVRTLFMHLISLFLLSVQTKFHHVHTKYDDVLYLEGCTNATRTVRCKNLLSLSDLV